MSIYKSTNDEYNNKFNIICISKMEFCKGTVKGLKSEMTRFVKNCKKRNQYPKSEMEFV